MLLFRFFAGNVSVNIIIHENNSAVVNRVAGGTDALGAGTRFGCLRQWRPLLVSMTKLGANLIFLLLSRSFIFTTWFLHELIFPTLAFSGSFSLFILSISFYEGYCPSLWMGFSWVETPHSWLCGCNFLPLSAIFLSAILGFHVDILISSQLHKCITSFLDHLHIVSIALFNIILFYFPF